MTSQIRRAAVSVPSNIGEGNERSGDRDFLRFLEIAKGSCTEVSIQLQIAYELGYVVSQNEYTNIQSMLEEIRRMLSGLQKKLR